MALFGPINPEPQQNMLKGMANVEELQKAQIANALARIQEKYAPQMAEAEIGLKHGQEFENRGRGAHYYAEATTAPSRIGLNNAQAGHMNALTKYLPQELALKEKQLQQQTGRFGAAYQMARMLQAMPSAARATWIAQNQEAYAGMMAELGNQIPSAINAPLDQPSAPISASNALSQTTPNGAASPQNALMQPSAQNMPLPVTNPRFAPANADQIAQLAKANEMAANAALTTARTRTQMEGAIQLEGYLNDPYIQNQAINAAQYAGALGKGKAAIDALLQKNPEAYEDYLAFKNSTMVGFRGRFKTLENMGATDEQRKEMYGMYDKTMDALTSNPAQFIIQYNKLGELVDTIARNVQHSASPVANVNRLEGFNPIGGTQNNPSLSKVSDDELRKIAGM